MSKQIKFYEIVNFFPIKICKQIVRELKGIKFNYGWTLNGNKAWCDCKIAWWGPKSDTLNLIPYFREYMVSNAEYQIIDYEWPYLISKFNKNEIYDWHNDNNTSRSFNKNRILTVVCQISNLDPITVQVQGHTFNLKQGDGIFFPTSDEYKLYNASDSKLITLTAWARTLSKIS